MQILAAIFFVLALVLSIAVTVSTFRQAERDERKRRDLIDRIGRGNE